MAEKINQIEIDGTTYDLQDKDAKAPFTGTKAEVQLAIDAGEIKEGDIVNITDDIGDYPGGDIPSGTSNIVYLTQEQYDALPDDKLEDDIEYWIADAGVRGSAENVSYDASASGLDAKNVQEAVDKLVEGAGNKVEYLTQEEYDALPEDKLTNNVEYRILDSGTPTTARNVGYDGSASGIDAVNVQGAIDDLKEDVGTINESLGMDLKLIDGVPHWSARGADSFSPFSRKGYYVPYLCVNYHSGDAGGAFTKLKSKGCTILRIGSHVQDGSLDNLIHVNGTIICRETFSTPREFDISQYTNDEYITVSIQTSNHQKNNYLTEIETF